MRRIPAGLVFLSVGFLFLFLSQDSHAYPEYSAYSGSNCMACHTGPIGGFGRKPFSSQDPGYLTEKFYMSGDFQFMALYDQRVDTKDRLVFFPMEGSLHFAFMPKPNITFSASQDFGTLREFYGMLTDALQTKYIRAGVFTLPYGLFFPDHTAFIIQGRVKTGSQSYVERGLGAGLYGVRFKDTGVEMGLSGKPVFASLAVTNGVLGQESRLFPTQQRGTTKAVTARLGVIAKHAAIGVSGYDNDNEFPDQRLKRWGTFGWLRHGPFALLFEHDEGKGASRKETNGSYFVSGSTRLAATYVELVYNFDMPGKNWPGYAILRYERLDPNKDLDQDILQRWVLSYRFYPVEYASMEAYYRKNLEEPREERNDEAFLIVHLFF